jgi:hypothetical protein
MFVLSAHLSFNKNSFTLGPPNERCQIKTRFLNKKLFIQSEHYSPASSKSFFQGQSCINCIKWSCNFVQNVAAYAYMQVWLHVLRTRSCSTSELFYKTSMPLCLTQHIPCFNSPNLEDWRCDNVLPGQDYHTTGVVIWVWSIGEMISRGEWLQKMGGSNATSNITSPRTEPKAP